MQSFQIQIKAQLKRKTGIFETAEINGRVVRLVYQSLFVDIADLFIKYIHLLDPDEIQEMDADIRSNG